MEWTRILLVIILAAAAVFILIVALDTAVTTAPKKPEKGGKAPGAYFSENAARIAYQPGPECAGFSCAYVLRCCGQEAEGMQLYRRMKPLFGTPARSPKELLKILDGQGFSAGYYKGTVEDLEKAVSSGQQVIALILTRPDKNWLHYVPVTGYDEKYLYLADSLAENANTAGKAYNRKIEKEDFIKLWDTRQALFPLLRNTYIAVKPAEKA